jgi:hypothetical protein
MTNLQTGLAFGETNSVKYDALPSGGKIAMEVQIFGKKECGRCSVAKSRIQYIIKKMSVENKVSFCFLDVETPEGLAESMFFDVADIPTTIVKHNQQEVARWDGKPPLTSEFGKLIDKIVGST